MLSLRPVRILVVSACALVAGHVIALVLRQGWDVDENLGLVRQFDLNGEGNLAAWFASFVLANCALAALVIGIVKRLDGERLGARWTAFAAFVLLMAVDETAQLHDMATGPTRRALNVDWGVDFGVLYFAWIVPALLVLAGAVLYFRPLLGSVAAGVRAHLVIAVLVYFGGAVGFEMISGSVAAGGRRTTSYLAVITVEETLELVGALLVLTALLRQLAAMRPQLLVRWTGDAPELLRAVDATKSTATDHPA